MRNLKKVLSLVIALTFVLSTVAFASPTSDIEDENVKEAVERLVAFGIVSGKDDGLYHPEENLTREQFAKLVVEAMGLGAAAQASGGDTGFVDVAADRWSAGYVQVASGKGIIKGKGDGTFDPEAGVTYPEAVTMLVRALGYKDEFLTGAWPSNYVGKAAELDIPLGAKYAVNGVVDRGAAAVLVNNTLDADVIEQETYGDDNNWEESGETLLEAKLDIDKYEDCTVKATPAVDDGLNEDEITIFMDDEDWENSPYYQKDKDFELVGESPDGLLFLEGDMYLNDDDDIVYFDVTTDEDDIIVGWIKDSKKDEKDKLEIKFADGSKEKYDYNTDLDTDDDDKFVSMYINNEEPDNDNDTEDGWKNFEAGQYGTFVLNDDGDVQFANVYTINDYVVAQDIDTDDETIKGYYINKDDKKIDLTDEDGYKIFKDGELIDIDDVEVGDVVMVTDVVKEVDGDDYLYCFVSSNTVTGNLDSAKGDELEIDDETYDTWVDKVGYSLDDGDSIDEYTKDDGPGDIENAIGEDITAYLDIKGEIVFFETDAATSSSTMYGIVTKTNEITDDSVKIFNSKGEEITYDLDDDAKAKIAGFRNGDIVAFELDSDGNIDYDGDPEDSKYGIIAGFYDNKTDMDVSTPIKVGDLFEATKAFESEDEDRIVIGTVDSFDDDNDYIKVDGTKYFIEDDTMLVSYYDKDYIDDLEDAFSKDKDIVDPSKVNWEDIESKDFSGLSAVVITDDDELNAEFVVFTEGYNLSGDITVAYLLGDPSNIGGDYEIEVVEADGTETTYVLDDDDDHSDLDEGDFILFDKTDDGKVNDFDVIVRDNVYATTTQFDNSTDQWHITAGTVTDSSSTTISVKLANGVYEEADASYRTDDVSTIEKQRILSSTGFYENVLKNTGAYDEVEEIDSSDIDDGDFVMLVQNDDDDDLIMVIRIDYSEYEDFKDNWELIGDDDLVNYFD